MYDFQFEFERSSDPKDGWDVTVAWRDKKTGEIPTDISTHNIGVNWPNVNGISKPMITFSAYKRVDFQTDFPDGTLQPEPGPSP